MLQRSLEHKLATAAQAEVESEAEEWGDSFQGYVMSECPDIVEKCEEEYLEGYKTEFAAEEADILIERCLENLRMEEKHIS